MPTTEISEADLPIGLLQLMTNVGLSKSNGEARQMVKQGGVSVNDEKVDDFRLEITKDLFEDGRIIIKRGKKTSTRWNSPKDFLQNVSFGGCFYLKLYNNLR